MTVIEIINSVVAGGLLGSLGQGIRLAVGLKKLNSENSKKEIKGGESEPVSGSRLILSIFIGFIAGAIGMIVKGSSLAPDGNYNTESIITIIVIGYSGADFIEGLFNTYLAKFNPSSAATGTAGATATTAVTATTTVTAPAAPAATDSQKPLITNPDEDIVG